MMKTTNRRRSESGTGVSGAECGHWVPGGAAGGGARSPRVLGGGPGGTPPPWLSASLSCSPGVYSGITLLKLHPDPGLESALQHYNKYNSYMRGL